MISRLLMKHLTTVPSIVVVRTVISLACFSLFLAESAAQSTTPPQALPSRTQWRPYPSSLTPAMSQPELQSSERPRSVTPPQPLAPIGSRVILNPSENYTEKQSLTRQPSSYQPDVAPSPVNMMNQVPSDNTPSRANDILKEFRFDSDATLNQRIKDSIKTLKLTENPELPPLAPISTQPYQSKTSQYPPLQVRLEPGYLVHRRLYFEELNSERYGWDLGAIQPFVSTLFFYKDVVLWPSKMASNIFERYETNIGKCPPGSPVPYYLYPPEITITGGVVGAGTLVGAAFLFP